MTTYNLIQIQVQYETIISIKLCKIRKEKKTAKEILLEPILSLYGNWELSSSGKLAIRVQRSA